MNEKDAVEKNTHSQPRARSNAFQSVFPFEHTIQFSISPHNLRTICIFRCRCCSWFFFSLHFSLCFVLVYISVSSFWNSFCRFSLRLRWICVLKLEAHKCLSHRFCWPFLVCLFHFSSHVRFYPCTISKRYWWYFLRRFSITMLPCAKNGASFMFISEAKLSLDYFGAFWL